MITYDETKRAINLKKHGLDLAIAGEVLAGFTISQEDTRASYGEIRLKTLGLYRGVVVVVVIHTPRGSADHIISIRKADHHEKHTYWQNYPA